jgi:hypothetical protein
MRRAWTYVTPPDLLALTSLVLLFRYAAPLELVRLMSTEEQWSRCFNVSGPVVAGLKRKDLFLVIEANLTLVRRKITTATSAIQDVERAAAAFCARTSWPEEDLEVSWSAADLRDTVLAMLAGPGTYHQLWALWTLNYISTLPRTHARTHMYSDLFFFMCPVNKPDLDKAPVRTNWPRMISQVVLLTGHRFGTNAALAASLLLAMQPAWSLMGTPLSLTRHWSTIATRLIRYWPIYYHRFA